MKFCSLTSTAAERDSLAAEFKNGREIGIVKLGETCLFFRRKLRVYYVPYTEVSRAFRRVMSVPAKMCCGKGEFIIEHLVICVGDNEVAQIQLPGTKAAKILMDELKEKMPDAIFSSLKSDSDKAEEDK